MKVTSIEELFGTLQQSVVAEWRKHLKTSKYSKHMALDEFYKEMPDKVDTLIEDYMGHTGEKVEDYTNVLKAEDLDALQYLKELHEVCVSGREFLDGVSELESDLDDILSLIDSTMYKVKELRESKMKNLKDFLNESLLTESRLSSTNFIKAIRELDKECEGQDIVPILKGNDFNPVWLKAATSDGWENLGVDPNDIMLSNSEKTVWSRILKDIKVKRVNDVVRWINDNIDDIIYELSGEDPINIAIDVLPVFYNNEV